MGVLLRQRSMLPRCLAGFVGEQRQTFLGFNPTGGVNLRVTFTLWPAGH